MSWGLIDWTLVDWGDVQSKGCCGTAPELWKGGNWRCSECDGIVTQIPNSQLNFPKLLDDVLPTGVLCDCGAVKAKTTHANWCSTNGEK